MKLNQLFESAGESFILILARDSAVSEFANDILRKTGYVNVGHCGDYDQAEEWDDSIEYESTILEDIEIWAKSEPGPSMKEIMDALASQEVIEYEY
jgi:hypothetical protein